MQERRRSRGPAYNSSISDQNPLTSNINPYRPLPETPRDQPSPDVLPFDGVIGEDDYIDLLPRNLLVWWLNLVLAILLVPAVLLVTGIVVCLILAGRNDAPTFAMIGLLAVLGALRFVSVRTLGAKYRGRRHLRRHPDLVGTVRGILNESGLFYSDGASTFWFAPASLVGVSVSAKGIRIPKDANQYRYVALISRLFDHYSVKVAHELLGRWKIVSSEPDDPERWILQPFDQGFGEPWMPTDDASTKLVRFSGWVKTERPMRSPELRMKAWIETGSIFAYCAGAVIAWFYGSMLLMIVVLFFMSAATISSIKMWRQYRFGIQSETWNQAGWLSENSLAWRTDTRGIHLSLDQFVTASVTAERATFTDREGQVFLVPRGQVADDSDWHTLSHRVETLGTSVQY